jgi:hypothetical protein
LDQNQWIVAFFAGSWLAVLGGFLVFVIYALKQVNLTMTTVPILLYDTLVFLAITWHLSRNSYACHVLQNGFKFLVFGDYLPVFTKVLSQDGQAYYFSVLFLTSYVSWLNVLYVLSIGPSLL